MNKVLKVSLFLKKEEIVPQMVIIKLIYIILIISIIKRIIISDPIQLLEKIQGKK